MIRVVLQKPSLIISLNLRLYLSADLNCKKKGCSLPGSLFSYWLCSKLLFFRHWLGGDFGFLTGSNGIDGFLDGSYFVSSRHYTIFQIK